MNEKGGKTAIERQDEATSELRWQKTFNAVNDAICILDMSGKILQCNRAMCEFMKMRMSDIIGKTCWVLVHCTSTPIKGCPVEHVKETRKRETNVLPLNGRWFNVTADPLFDENNDLIGAVHIIQDITEQKNLDDELLGEKEFIETMVNCMPGTFYIIDHKGRFIRWNKAIEEMTGYSAEKLHGMNALQIIHEDDRKRIAEKIREVFETGSFSQEETRVYTKNGEQIHILTGKRMIVGKEMYLIGNGMDITERKKTDKALKESEERYRKLAETAHDAIFIVSCDNRIQYINSFAAKNMGFLPEEIIGEKIEKIFPSEQSDIMKQNLQRICSKGEPFYAEEHISRQNQDHWQNSWLVPIKDSSGKVNEVMGISRDITMIKHAEDAMRIAKVEAERANLVKNNFLHTMSHELRTPLNAILGFSEILKHETYGELNDKQIHFVNNIIEGGSNLLNIIAQILEVVSMDEGMVGLVIEKINIHETVNNVLSDIKKNAEVNNIDMELNIDPQLEYIHADKQKLKKILITLLDNAMKFSKHDGGIIKINIKNDEEMVRFSVSDTGIGIKEEDLTNLFRKFTQLDSGLNRRYGGIGIGLVIAKQFVEMQGGTITASSKYNEGSTFTFTLPIAVRRMEKYNEKSTCS